MSTSVLRFHGVPGVGTILLFAMLFSVKRLLWVIH